MAAWYKAWVCGRSFAGIVGSNPGGAWMFVWCECCVLSGRGICVGQSLVQRNPTECGVFDECDREASTVKGSWPTGAWWAMGGGEVCS